MRKLVLLLAFLLGVGTSFTLSAQKIKTVVPKQGHKLVFKIDNAKDKVVYLAIHYREKLLLRDSAMNDGRGIYMFLGDNYMKKVYILWSPKLKYLI